MQERYDAPDRLPEDWSHLPPPEQSLLLKRDRKGSVRVIEKIPTPVDEFGIPDSDEILRIAMSTLSSDYVPPGVSNIHHRIYPRDRYHNHPSGSVAPKLYRESAFNMVRYQQQLHNYLHAIFKDPDEADMSVMFQCAREQAQTDELYFIGQTAIQLSRDRYQDVTDDVARTHLRFNALQDSRRFEGLFYDFLEAYPDGQIGLFPDKEWLASQSLRNATRALGVLAGARSLDARRDASILVKKIGIA